jgi:hypothetical protein
MAVSSDEISSDGEPTPTVVATPVDSASLDPIALAEAVLARKLRPRAADVRRMAQALLDTSLQPTKKKKKKKGDKKAEKKAAGKKRKLSKIPGQQES